MIIHEQTNDPLTWKETFNLDRGAILGLSHSFFNVLCFRPKTRHEEGIGGLYFVGASTHPGTGVPICLAGGKIVSKQILEDQSMEVPWEEGGIVEAAALSKSNASKTTAQKEMDDLHAPLTLLGWLIRIILGIIAVGLFLLLWVNAIWLDRLALKPIPWADEYIYQGPAESGELWEGTWFGRMLDGFYELARLV